MTRDPQLRPIADWKISTEPSGTSEDRPTSNDLVMAWARDKDTHEPRYILELNERQRGAKCNCVCVSCELSLIAVNAAKTEYQQRPHFRHPSGAERNSCFVLAARFAIAQQLLEQGLIELPRRRRSASVAGLSGEFHEAWIELPPERVRIIDTKFKDKATALLTLDDGRQLVVELTGSLSEQHDEQNTLIPVISLNISDPAIASMSPDELRKRLTLLWAGACWHSHWKDSELIHQAAASARQMASEALDWLDDGEGLDDLTGLSPDQRRETLLHREVKAILEREKRIQLPELFVRVERNAPRREPFTREKRWSSEYVNLDNVRLEKRLGRVIPDVLAKVLGKLNAESEYQLLIEVAVTNPINEERLERIREVNLPTLEIDIGRMGGLVTREELVKLVVDEVAGKRWVHHPKATAEVDRFNSEIDAEVEYFLEREQRRSAALNSPLEHWANSYLDAIRKHGNIRANYGKPSYDPKDEKKTLDLVQDCAHALSLHGYPEAEDKELLNIIERLLSIKDDKGVGYRLETGWQVINAVLQDKENKWTWHTLYLMAIRQYQPKLSKDNADMVEEWRNRVLKSIKEGSTPYLRSPKYDKLIGLLFPEMGEALNKDFGRRVPSQQPKLQSQAQVKPEQFLDTGKNDFWLKGRDLERWKFNNPEAAKLWFGKK